MDAIDIASAGIRSAAFIAALQAAGLGWFAVGCCRDPADASRVRAWRRGAASFAVVLVLTHRMLDAGRLAGEWSGIFDAKLEALVWQHRGGWSTLACAAGSVMAATRFPRIAAAGGILIAASFGLMGHTTEASHARLLEAVVVVHVGIVAFWFGGVVGLRRVTQDLAGAAARFSRLAGWLVPWTLALGLALIWGLLPGPEALLSTYGALLLAKVFGFAVVLALAAINRLRVVPALASGRAGAARTLRRILLGEMLVLGSVLAATAVMTSLFSPG